MRKLNLKVGDKVYSLKYGAGKVIAVQYGGHSPLSYMTSFMDKRYMGVRYEVYTLKGCIEGTYYKDLYKKKPIITSKQRLTQLIGYVDNLISAAESKAFRRGIEAGKKEFATISGPFMKIEAPIVYKVVEKTLEGLYDLIQDRELAEFYINTVNLMVKAAQKGEIGNE